MSIGIEGKAKGITGCWLVLAEWSDKTGEWHRISVKSFEVDGIIVKENTFYMLKDGQLTETN